MKDRTPTKPNRYAVYDDNHIFLRYEYHERADEPIEDGDALNKGNLLPDDVAAALGLTGNPQVKDALLKLATFGISQQVFKSSGTFIAPYTGTYYIQVCGRGGNAIYQAYGPRVGGGGGGYCAGMVTLNKGDSIPVSVGAPSSFGNYLTANAGGDAANAGGEGGTAFGGDIQIYGTKGSNSQIENNSPVGTGGASFLGAKVETFTIKQPPQRQQQSRPPGGSRKEELKKPIYGAQGVTR